MPNKKLRVGVVCGGVSAEHEISLLSTVSVIKSLNTELFEIELIGIDKKGRWLSLPLENGIENVADPKKIALNTSHSECFELTLKPWAGSGLLFGKRDLAIDLFFPILHGPRGEDGTVQSIFTLAEVPYVGPSVLSAVLGMDKDVMKRLLRDAQIPIANFIVYNFSDDLDYSSCRSKLGDNLFVKPANMGSSVGVTKVKSEKEFLEATKLAFTYDTKIIVEEEIIGREIECAVLGNESPKASLLGELKANHEFYSYSAKYLDSSGAQFQIPVALTPKLTEEMQQLAIKAYTVLGGEGMARVDFFLREDKFPLVNEVNTIPGFTSISMYPKLWEVSGLPYTQLLDSLINFALTRQETKQALNKVL
jgi:D-alanine-D-alanine ligase